MEGVSTELKNRFYDYLCTSYSHLHILAIWLDILGDGGRREHLYYILDFFLQPTKETHNEMESAFLTWYFHHLFLPGALHGLYHPKVQPM